MEQAAGRTLVEHHPPRLQQARDAARAAGVHRASNHLYSNAHSCQQTPVQVCAQQFWPATSRTCGAPEEGPLHVYCKIAHLRRARQQPAQRGQPVRVQVAGRARQGRESNQRIQLLHVRPGIREGGSQRVQRQLRRGHGRLRVEACEPDANDVSPASSHQGPASGMEAWHGCSAVQLAPRWTGQRGTSSDGSEVEQERRQRTLRTSAGLPHLTARSQAPKLALWQRAPAGKARSANGLCMLRVAPTGQSSRCLAGLG